MFLNEFQKYPSLIGFTKFKLLKFMLNFGFIIFNRKEKQKFYLS